MSEHTRHFLNSITIRNERERDLWAAYTSHYPRGGAQGEPVSEADHVIAGRGLFADDMAGMYADIED